MSRRTKTPLDHLADFARYYHPDQYEKAHIMEARRLGLSWEEIAQALGRSPESVWERWHADDDAADHDADCALSTGGDFAYINVSMNYGLSQAIDWDDREAVTKKNQKFVLKRLRDLGQYVARNEEGMEYWVDQARSEKATWTQISHALGISRQAAYARYK
jgi:DNA-binding transcriptional MerR regulator